MRILKLTAFILACAMAANAHALRLVTWNLEHLVDRALFAEWRLACRDTDEQERVDIPYCDALNGLSFPCATRKSEALQDAQAYDEKRQLLRAKAAELNGDVYAFQEVSSADALGDILPADQYRFFVSSSGISQEIAFAVRKPFVEQLVGEVIQHDQFSIKDELGRATRPALELNLRSGDRTLALLNVHLKSGCAWWPVDDAPVPDKASCAIYPEGQTAESLLAGKTQARARGCRMLRRQIPLLEDWIEEKTRKGVEFIIMGDFNRNFERDRQFSGRLNPRHVKKPNHCVDGVCIGKIGAMTHEMSDDEPPGAKIWVAPSSYGDWPDEARYIEGRYRCHPYDYFMFKRGLWDGLREADPTINAEVVEYAEIPEYSQNTVIPSDHCPVLIDVGTLQ